MFPTRTLLKLFAVLEEELGVNRFVAGGFHVWPALRFLLATKFQDNDQSKERVPAALQAEAEVVRRFDALMARQPPRPDLSMEDVRRIAPRVHAITHQNVLIMSRPDDHSLSTGKGFYAPITDPWVELVATRWPYVKAEFSSPMQNSTLPRYMMTLTIPKVGALQHSAGELLERTTILKAGRALSTALVQWMAANLGANVVDLPDVFDAELTALWTQKQIYREVLQAQKPGLVLVTCFYYPPSVSVVWAARELGIPVADLQHGGNGEYHIGYTHWRHVPPGGYHMLPDYFFVWDNLSANNILRWMPAEVAAHQPLLTGRFGLSYAKRAVLGATAHSPIEALRQGSDKTILVTLQTLASTGLTPMLLEAMTKAPPTWTWLVRGHPIAQSWGKKELMPDALAATLKGAGIKRAEVHFSTALPLAAILPYINHHVTGFSGTVQECAMYGVRTTFTHPTVWSFFGNYIGLGAADFAQTADELLASITSDRPFPDLSNVLTVPREDGLATTVLSQILKTS
jgi:hypothetical protein